MRKIKCWKHTGHGMVGDASTTIQFSCNDYLCEFAYRMGMGNGEEGRNGTEEREGDREYTDSVALGKLREYASLFCLNEKSGVEIAESASHITDAYGITSAIGQGTAGRMPCPPRRPRKLISLSNMIYKWTIPPDYIIIYK